jgi:hypothetical protein
MEVRTRENGMCVEISPANTLLQLGFGANAVMPFFALNYQ